MSHVAQQGPGEDFLESSEISATFMVLATAGSETTVTTLCRAFGYLIALFDKLVIVTTEIRSPFQHMEEITLAAVQGLLYLNAVINEALRPCPAVPRILPRIVPEGGDAVCGAWLPGGASIIPCLVLISSRLTVFHFRRRFRYKHGHSFVVPINSTIPLSSNSSGG
jgi:cytochrome P450